MARLTIDKCCCCIGLRRGSISCACLFLLTTARYLYQGVLIIISYMRFYSTNQMDLETKVETVYGCFHTFINAINAVLVILLFIGLFNVNKINRIRWFYRGVLSTTIVNSIAVALFLVLQYKVFNSYKKNYQDIYLFIIAEYVIYAVMVLIYLLVTRSYYYSVVEEREEEDVEKVKTHV